MFALSFVCGSILVFVCDRTTRSRHRGRRAVRIIDAVCEEPELRHNRSTLYYFCCYTRYVRILCLCLRLMLRVTIRLCFLHSVSAIDNDDFLTLHPFASTGCAKESVRNCWSRSCRHHRKEDCTNRQTIHGYIYFSVLSRMFFCVCCIVSLNVFVPFLFSILFCCLFVSYLGYAKKQNRFRLCGVRKPQQRARCAQKVTSAWLVCLISTHLFFTVFVRSVSA